MSGPKHWDYLNEYKRAADGSYVYVGDSYTLNGPENAKKHLGLLWALCFVTVICSGISSAAGLRNSFYVILPYIGEVVCVFNLSWQTVRFLYNKGDFKHYYYKKLVNNIPASSFLMSVFAGIGFIGSGVFLFLHGFEGMAAQSVIQLVLRIATVALGVLVYRYFKTFEWEKKEKNND